MKEENGHRASDNIDEVTRNGESLGGSDSGNAAARKHGGKPQRAQAILGRGRAVVVIGRALDLDMWLQILQEAITRGRRAKSYGLSLDAFLRMSRDSAQR